GPQAFARVGAAQRLLHLRQGIALQDVNRHPAALGLTEDVGAATVVVLERQDQVGAVKIAQHPHRQVELAYRLLEVEARYAIWENRPWLASRQRRQRAGAVDASVLVLGRAPSAACATRDVNRPDRVLGAGDDPPFAGSHPYPRRG